VGCSNFLEIGKPTAGAYSDPDLAANTSFRYRVRALDGVGLWSQYSNVATALTDTTPPSPPTDLAAHSPHPNIANLTWTAATDPGGSGVANQMLWRCMGSDCSAGYTLIATLSGAANSYGDTSVAANTWYHYYLTATDVAGNVSAHSNVANIRTENPTNPTLTAISPDLSTINLSWRAPEGIASQRVWRCIGSSCAPGYTHIATLSSTANSYSDTTLPGTNSYHYYVTSHDAGGAEVARSTVANIQVTRPDTSPPSIPQNVAANAPNATTVSLTWSASSDTGGSGLQSYRVERCTGSGCTNFAFLAATATAAYSDTTVSQLTTYRYRVSAVDGAGNASEFSSAATVTTPDTTPPNSPTGLSAAAPSAGRVNLSWNAATDPGGSGVANQKLWRCTGSNCSAGYTLIATLGPSVTSYSDTTVVATTVYHYYLTATDVAGNVSATSTVANIQTPSASNPNSTLTGSAPNSSTINLSWTAPEGVTAQRLWRCIANTCGPGYTLHATLSAAASSYTDANLTPGTWYRYYVTSIDAAGNELTRSTVANVRTPN
jgi:fibronectin type 3 domain-containing protein